MWVRFLDLHAFRWSLFLPIVLASGAAWYLTATNEPPHWAIIIASLAAVASFLHFRRRNRPSLAFVALLVAVFPIGALVAMSHALLAVAPRIEERTPPVRIEGVLARVEAGQNGNRLLLQVSAISDMPRTDTPRKIRVTQKNDTQISPGRPLSCLAILMPPPAPSAPGDYNFQRQAWFDGLGGVGFVLGECKPAVFDTTRRGPFAPASDWINAVRRSLALSVFDMAGAKGGGVAAAMVSGDRSLMSVNDADTLRNSGLAHLLAISGLHMGLAGGVFFFGAQWLCRLIEPLALRAPPRKVASLVALSACTTYLMLSGAAVATQRAYIMATVAFLAVLFDRAALSGRSLAIAMTAVILIQPQSVTTPGFHMSFAATAALIAMYEAWPKASQTDRSSLWGRFSSGAVSITVTSVVASLATAPYSAYHFGRVALWSIPANLAVMPIISIWTTPMAALAAVFSVVGLQEPFIKSMGYSLGIILDIARVFADDGSAQSSWPPLGQTSFLLFTASILLALVLKKNYRAIALPVMFAGTVAWWQSPVPVMLLSTNGDLFVRESTHWVKVSNLSGAFAKGAMDPMQASDSLETSRCEQRSCQYDVAKGWLLTLKQSSQGKPEGLYLTRLRPNGSTGDKGENLNAVLNGTASIKITVSHGSVQYTTVPEERKRPRPWGNQLN